MFSSSTIINCWYSFHLERPITKASRRLNSVGFSCSKYLHNYVVYLTNLCYFACFCLKIFKQTRFKKGNVLFSRLVIKYSGDCFEAIQNTHSTRSNNLKPLKSAVRVLNITYSKDLIYKYCQRIWIKKQAVVFINKLQVLVSEIFFRHLWHYRIRTSRPDSAVCYNFSLLLFDKDQYRGQVVCKMPSAEYKHVS